jgi:hypothetical protein
LRQIFNIRFESRVPEQRARERGRQLRIDCCAGIARNITNEIRRKGSRNSPDISNQPIHAKEGSVFKKACLREMIVKNLILVIEAQSRQRGHSVRCRVSRGKNRRELMPRERK